VDKNFNIARKLGTWGYPITLLVKSNGETITQIPGYVLKKEFKKIVLMLKSRAENSPYMIHRQRSTSSKTQEAEKSVSK